MAKANTTPTETPSIEVEHYRPTQREGVYDAHVQAMIDAEPEFPEGEYPAVTIQVPNGEKNPKGEYIGLAKHIRYFQESAKTHERTARIVDGYPQDNGDGSSKVKFILKAKITRARKPKETGEGSAEAPAEAEAIDTPEAVAA